MVFVLAIPALAAVELTVNKVDGIEIDGVRDEGYSGPVDINVPWQNFTGTNQLDDSVANGKAWIAWDDDALYYYIEVYDETPNHTQDGRNDAVEIFIDWNKGQGGEASLNEDASNADYTIGNPDGCPAWQVRVFAAPDADGYHDLKGCILETELGFGGGVAFDPYVFDETCTFVTGPIEEGNWRRGYYIEIRIPKPAGGDFMETGSSVDVTLSIDKQIPFDFQIWDNILGVGTRDAQIFMEDSPFNNLQWGVPSAYHGLMTLAGYAETDEPDDDDETDDDDIPSGFIGGDDDGDDDEEEITTTTAPPATTRPPQPKVGDSNSMIFVILAIAAIGALAVAKRAGRNKA